MKAGASAMKGIRGNIDSDTVDDMMDEIQEEKDIHDSISEAISRPGQDLFDDQDLLNELAELDALESEEELLTPPPRVTTTVPNPTSVFNLPNVPTSNIQPASRATATRESDDEKALRELQASMMS